MVVCSGVPATGAAVNSVRRARSLRRADGRDGAAPGAGELFVVALLQAGEADVVAGPDPALALLDQLGGRRADGAEDRRGEVLGRSERQLVGNGARARDGPTGPKSGGHLGCGRRCPARTPADRRPGLLGERGRVDVDEGPADRRAPRWPREPGLVEPDAEHRAQGDEGLVLRAEDLAALRRSTESRRAVRPGPGTAPPAAGSQRTSQASPSPLPLPGAPWFVGPGRRADLPAQPSCPVARSPSVETPATPTASSSSTSPVIAAYPASGRCPPAKRRP